MQVPFFLSDGEGEKWLRDHPYYCAKPFYSKTYEQDNKVSWCCHWTKPLHINEFNSFNREIFYNNKPINGCEFCYSVEHSGGLSERITESIDILVRKRHYLESPMPSHMYIRFSNLCNVSCRMCDETQSTLWDKVNNKKYGLYEISDENWKCIQQDIQCVDDNGNSVIKEVHLFGGETLLSQRLPSLLRMIDPDVSLTLSTNCTIYKPEVFDLLSRLNRVDFMLSIDGVGLLNDYLRWPSKWTTIKRNVNKFFNYDFNFIATPAINVYNVLHIRELIDFYEPYMNNGINITIIPQFCWEPDWMNIEVLPSYILEEVKKEINDLYSHRIFEAFPVATEGLLNCLDTVLSIKSKWSEGGWDSFKKNTAFWDATQNMKFSSVCPKLHTYIEKNSAIL